MSDRSGHIRSQHDVRRSAELREAGVFHISEVLSESLARHLRSAGPAKGAATSLAGSATPAAPIEPPTCEPSPAGV